jgi:hypothetical protein
MALQNEGRPQAEFRQGASAIAQLGGKERTETNPNPDPAQRQTEARELETLARGHALAAVCLGGAQALQHVALSAHYAQRAVCKMIGRRA